MSIENQVHELQELLESFHTILDAVMATDTRFEMVHELSYQLRDEVNLLVDE